MFIYFHEILNPLPTFKVWYSEILQIIYYMVKECHFTDIGLLHEFAFYEVYDLFDIYQKEIEEKNKQAKKDNEQMEVDMANMQSNMNRSMSNNPMSNISMPKMPNLPSL